MREGRGKGKERRQGRGDGEGDEAEEEEKKDREVNRETRRGEVRRQLKRVEEEVRRRKEGVEDEEEKLQESRAGALNHSPHTEEVDRNHEFGILS